MAEGRHRRTPARVGPCLTLLAVAALVGAGPGSRPVRAGSIAPDTPAASPSAVPSVSLAGPFGRFDGVVTDLDHPPSAQTALRPLDAYGRGARLVAAARDPRLAFADWVLTAVPEPDLAPGQRVELGRSGGGPSQLAAVDAPGTGVWLVRLDATLGAIDAPFAPPQATGSWLWLVVVPDRDVPGDDEPYPPLPAFLLSTTTSTIELEPGSGCFVDTCGDIGAPPPDGSLPVLHAPPGAPLRLSLGDGSGLVRWTVEARPAGDEAGPSIVLARDDAGISRSSAIFAAPGTGDWVLEVHLAFDLERGAFGAYGRLAVP